VIKDKSNLGINIATIGVGNWGRNLVRNFAELGVLQCICDNQQDLKELQEKYSIKNTCANYEELLKSSEIQAVVIATPAATHYEITKAALLAGKDVFVEKPLALDAKEGEELIRLANEHDCILMVDHLLQFHPAVTKLKEIIDNGTLGKLQYIYSHRLNIGKLRNEENILWSFAPHDISVILYLVDDEPQDVFAVGEAYLQDNIFDTTITHLTFTNRLKAHIYVSWLHPFKEQKMVVIGDKGMAVFNDLEEDKLVLYPHKIEWIKQIPVAAKAEKEIIPIDQKEPLRAACEHFLHCVQNRLTPQTDGKEALAVLNILQQAQEKLDIGRLV